MKAEMSATTTPSSTFDCAVCGAQLDPLHLETGHEGLLCSFCGSPQGRTAGRPDLKLVSSDGWAPDVGEALRNARKVRGETLEQAAHFTRIRLSYLRDLEVGDISSFESYPGRVYARFFLREYADHLGLDPAPLVRRFDRDAEPVVQPARPVRYSRRAPHPGRWATGALALLVAVLIAGAIVSREPGQLPITPLASRAGAAHAASLPHGRTHPTSTPPIAPTGIRVVIHTDQPCWILAVADGATTMEKTVPAGRTVQLRASDTMDLRLGNAGGVALRMNGRSIPTGGAGEIVDLSFARHGGRVVRV